MKERTDKFLKNPHRILRTYPNQKVITINKAKTSKEQLYFTNNIQTTYQAMKKLKPCSFKLWLYLCMNQNGYKFALSPADVLEKTDMPSASYSRAVEELVKLHYLVQRNDHSNLYDFFEDNLSNQNDSNKLEPYQNDSSKPYQFEEYSNQIEGQPYQIESYLYQKDIRNTTDNINNTNTTVDDNTKVIDLLAKNDKISKNQIEYQPTLPVNLDDPQNFYTRYTWPSTLLDHYGLKNNDIARLEDDFIIKEFKNHFIDVDRFIQNWSLNLGNLHGQFKDDFHLRISQIEDDLPF